MNKDDLTKFLLAARDKTFATDKGKAKPLLKGSRQNEYKEGEWFYRDIYYAGAGRFVGLETMYFRDAPVWSLSYFGNFAAMTEEETDRILRGVLIAKKNEMRMWTKVTWREGEFSYVCDGYGNIDELGGQEEIHKGRTRVYYFYYAGGVVRN